MDVESESNPTEGAPSFDVFLSYRRNDGSLFATWLFRRLTKFRLPRGVADQPPRGLRVFRDTAYERATSDYWTQKILPALRTSRFFLVVVTRSSEVAHVDGSPNGLMEELQEFLRHAGPARVIIVIGPGATENEIPRALKDASSRWDYVDFGDFRPTKLLWPTAWEDLDDRICKIVAALFALPSEKLPAIRDPERRRRTRLLVTVAATSLALAMTLGGLTWWALGERRRAVAAEQDARAKQDVAERRAHALRLLRADELCSIHPDDGARYLSDPSQFPSARSDVAFHLLRRFCSRATWTWSTHNTVDAVAWTSPTSVVLHQLDGVTRALDRDGSSTALGQFVSIASHRGETFGLTLTGDVLRVGGDGGLVARGGAPSLAFATSANGKVVAFLRPGRLVVVIAGRTILNVGVEARDRARVVLSSAGDRVLRFGDGALEEWDLTTGRNVPLPTEIEAAQVTAASYAEDGQLVVGGKLGAVLIRNGQQVQRIALSADVWSVAVSNDGVHVAAGDERGHIHLLDRRSSRQEAEWSLEIPGVRALAFDPEGAFLVATGARIGSESGGGVFRTDRMRPTREAETGLALQVRLVDSEAALVRDVMADTVMRMGPVPLTVDNALAMATAPPGVILLRDGQTCTMSAVGPASCRPAPVRPCHGSGIDPAAAFVACRAGAEIVVYNARGGDYRAPIHDVPAEAGVAIAAGGRFIAVGTDRDVLLYDFQQEAPRAPRHFFGKLAPEPFAPDGRFLVVWREDKALDVIPTAGGNTLVLLGRAPLLGSAFSSTGWYASRSKDDALVLLHLDTNVERRFVHAPEHPRSVLFVGDAVLVGTAEGSLRVWDIESGDERLRFQAAGGSIAALDAHEDGTLIVTSDDGKARLWSSRDLVVPHVR